MNKVKENIILIGMPGCGKSTIGVVLAKIKGYQYLDSDIVIQNQEGKLLREIIAEHGVEGFNTIENRVNANLDVKRCIIATGGSVVYGEEAMRHMDEIGHIVYLKLSCEQLAKRLGDLQERGVAMQEGQTLQDLYEERVPLYEKYAHITIDCASKDIWDIAREIASQC